MEFLSLSFIIQRNSGTILTLHSLVLVKAIRFSVNTHILFLNILTGKDLF